MSVSINNLFNYSRSLPVPFDTMTNKKVKVASMYGAKTESTLCGSVIKAVHAMCRCMNGTGEGAVGQIDTNKSVAEYKSSVGPDAYHLVVFDAASGSALASVYDKNTELIEQYVAHPSQRDGAAIFFALMPFLMSDAEFDETFQEYYDQFIAGYPDMAKATESMAILCDNAYRRIKDDTCPAHINITVDKSGNLMRVSQGQLDSGSFVPTSVTAGDSRSLPRPDRPLSKKPARGGAYGFRRQVSPDAGTHLERVGAEPDSETPGMVYHSAGSGGYLQACAENHRAAHADAKLPIARSCRYRQDYGRKSHCRRTGAAIHEVYLLCQHRNI